jgi:membrane-associated protease RseP (regulator of RpoE activity)
MNRAFRYGLVLLAAAVAGDRCALAGSGTEASSGFGPYFVGAAGGAPVRGAQGYLGVDVRDVSGDQLATLKLKDARGAEIVLVDHDAPAGKAGLREHDVVLQLNGQAVDGEEQIRRMLRESPPGRTIVLVISRNGQPLTVTVQMANREEVERKAWEQHITVPEPQDPPMPAADNDRSGYAVAPTSSSPPIHAGNSFIGTILMTPSYTGVTLEPLNAQLAQFFGAAAGKGLLVRNVVANSPAAQAGMQVGDVVVQADAKPVASSGDWSKAIKNSRGKSINVVVVRDKKEQTLTLTPDSKKRSSVEEPGEDSQPNAVAHMGFSLMSHS